MSDDFDKDVSEQIAKEMGIDTETPQRIGDDSADIESFYSSLRSQTQEETPTEEAPVEDGKKWVHEPTGKEFDSEVDYLRYDSSYNNDKWGKRFQELEERIAKATSRENSAEKPNEGVSALTKDELKKRLWPNQKDEYREDPISDFMLEGMDNALSIALGPLQQQLQASQETVKRLEAQLQETGLRSEYGVDSQTEQKLIEQHEWLASIPDAKSRMAAMKHLLSQTGAKETSQKLADKLPRRSAGDHVENSARIGDIPDPDETYSKFDSMDEKSQLGVLRRMVAGNGEFMGFNPND